MADFGAKIKIFEKIQILQAIAKIINFGAKIQMGNIFVISIFCSNPIQNPENNVQFWFLKTYCFDLEATIQVPNI